MHFVRAIRREDTVGENAKNYKIGRFTTERSRSGCHLMSRGEAGYRVCLVCRIRLVLEGAWQAVVFTVGTVSRTR